MRMLDWATSRRQVIQGSTDRVALNPDAVRRYLAINAAGRQTGNFDQKTRELIALAVALSLHDDGCIAIHSDAARKQGATEAELAETLSVAIGVNVGAALFQGRRTRRSADALTTLVQA